MIFSAINKPNSKAVRNPTVVLFAQRSGWLVGSVDEGRPRKACAASASRFPVLLPVPATQSLAHNLRPSRLLALPAAGYPLPCLLPGRCPQHWLGPGREAVLPRPACPGGAAFGFLP